MESGVALQEVKGERWRKVSRIRMAEDGMFLVFESMVRMTESSFAFYNVHVSVHSDCLSDCRPLLATICYGNNYKNYENHDSVLITLHYELCSLTLSTTYMGY